MRHNLPVPLTTLIGRTDELTAITDRLVDARVVTLTGSGGVGKTRLALAVATESMSRYPGGIWWLELAPLSNAAAVGPAALAVLDARQLPGVTAEQQLAAELGEQPSLLVLDNCEHVRARCAEIVAGVLAANASVAVLTTSREPLGVPGEVTWRVPSLTYPARDSILDHMTLSRFAAVELFVDRARRARPTFELRAVDRAGHRPDLSPLGRNPSSDRACRGTLRPTPGGAHRYRARRPLPVSHRRPQHGAAAPADACRLRRLEP